MKMMTPIDGMKDNTGNVFIRISDDKIKYMITDIFCDRLALNSTNVPAIRASMRRKRMKKMAGNGNYTAKRKNFAVI